MYSKKLYMFGMAVGSLAGGYIAGLLGASTFSFSALGASVLGGFAGIYLAHRLQQ